MRRRAVIAGMATTSLTVLMAGPSLAQQAAAPSDTAVGELVVTASPLAGDPDRFATIVDQVDRKSILANGGASLADALRDTPGVAGTGFAAGASRPVIRGMDAQRVKVVENGLSSSDVSDVGPDHGVPIDPLAAQTLEVVRGAATLRYGSQAIGGVVNAFNNRIPRRPISGFKGEATAAYDSVSDTGEGSLSLDAGQGALAIHLDGFGRRASDYDTPLGVQANSFFTGSGYSGGGSYFFGEGSRIGGAGVHYQARYGIPAEETYIDMHQDRGDFGAVFKPAGGPLAALNLDASYADYSHSEIDPAGPAVLSTFNNREWDGRAEVLLGPMGPLSGSALGVQFQDRRFDALGEGADYLLPTHTRSTAGFAFIEAPLGKLQFQGAARVDRTQIDGTPASNIPTARDFTPVSVSAGVSYEVNDRLRLGFTAASAGRAPAQTELFARGPHDGPASFETGDPSLRIERANSLEATARLRFASSGKLEASVWGARFSDYIYGALTGRTCDDTGLCAFGGAGDLKELNYGQRGADFYGAELKASVPIVHAGGGEVSANLLGDYVRARFSGGGDVPRIQPGRLGGGLGWSNERLDASFLVLAVSAQTHIGAGDSATAGYTSVDAQATWRPFGEAKRIEISLIGHNLANEEIRNATALNKAEVLSPGRDIRVTVRRRF
ncbi:TonB-dependent receptor [soil metagenome]